MSQRAAAVAFALACAVAAVPVAAAQEKNPARRLARAEFHAVCPFTVAAPSVTAVLDARRWNRMLAQARTVPPPYRAGGTNFKRESIFVVALPRTATPVTEAALHAKRPERFDADTGTLTFWYDVRFQAAKPGAGTTLVVGEPCLVTWTAARQDLQQVVARTKEGKYIAGTRTLEPKKRS